MRERTNWIVGGLMAAALTVAALACRVPHPDTWQGKAIRCSGEALERCWPTVMGPVNTCLGGEEASTCLLALIKPGTCTAEEIVACLVRKSGSEAVHASQANPADIRSARMATNAKAWIAERGYEFAGP